MIINKFNNLIKDFKRSFILNEKSLILSGTILENKFSELESLNELCDCEFSVFSQWSEDGIISWILNQLPNLPKNFIEFGVEDYSESNTRFLLQTKNWSGLVIDGCSENINKIKSSYYYWKHDLNAVRSFITKGNINNIITNNIQSDDIGLLSIDIDGNDYWVWNAINCIKPCVVIVEYNGVFGDLQSISVPYKPSFIRNKAHYSNLFFGCSIKSLIDLGKSKGYSLLGTNSNGLNAFFIREDYFQIIKEKVENVTIYPPKFRESLSKNGLLSFLAHNERLNQIKDQYVVNIPSNETVKLSSFNDIYSSNWNNSHKISI